MLKLGNPTAILCNTIYGVSYVFQQNNFLHQELYVGVNKISPHKSCVILSATYVSHTQELSSKELPTPTYNCCVLVSARFVQHQHPRIVPKQLPTPTHKKCPPPKQLLNTHVDLSILECTVWYS